MTSLQKAKAFFESKGKKLALAVAPLAMIAASAVPAHAGLVVSPFPTGPGGSITGGNGVASGGLFASPVIGSNGLPGLSITGGATETATSSGGTTLTFSYAGSVGPAFQSFFPSSVPIEWHFLATPSNNSNISWNLTYSFWDASTLTSDPPNTTGGFSGSALNVLGGTSAEFQGLGDVNLPATLANFQVDLNVLWDANGAGATLNLDIPTGSLDLNTPAPEPGSYLLMGAGMGLLLLRARRKSRA